MGRKLEKTDLLFTNLVLPDPAANRRERTGQPVHQVIQKLLVLSKSFQNHSGISYCLSDLYVP